MDYVKLLNDEKGKYERERGTYLTRIAGDITKFRYPHLEGLSESFEYNPDKKIFFLKNNQVDSIISKIATNEITVYELLNKEAKKLHLYDFFGYKATDEVKYNVFKSIQSDYLENQKNGKWNLEYEIERVNFSDLIIKKDFEYLRSFIKKSKDCEVYFCKFKDSNLNTFQFGSTLKGTNIVFVDGNKANFCQELFHSIYHIEEGIPGRNNDNMNIMEVWGNVDALYLKQLTEGRLSRRIRNNITPHDIKFLDYVFLRAYIGTAFLKEKDFAIFHSVFALIEPTIKLLMETMEKDIKVRNSIIIDGICYDNTEILKQGFNNYYGDCAYESIFYDFNLFHRMVTINKICKQKGISYNNIINIMFNEESLVPTIISSDVVKEVWLNPVINQDKNLIIDLIEDYSQIMIRQENIITIENWLEHINQKFGNEKYNKIKDLF